MRRWIYIFSTLIFAQYKLIDIIIILLLDLRRHRTLPCVQMWIRLWKGVFKVSPKRFYLSCSPQNLIRELAPKTATAAKTSLKKGIRVFFKLSPRLFQFAWNVKSGRIFWSWFLGDHTNFKEEKEKFVVARLRPALNVKLCIFTS